MYRAVQALLLSLIAGFGTAIGGALVVYFVNFRSEAVIGKLQALSAGVMIYISFFDILPEASQHLSGFYVGLFFFVGLIVMGLLDHFFPEELILRLMNSSSTHVVQNNNNISSINITNKTLGNGDEDDDDLEHGRSESGLSSQSRNIRSLMKTGWVTFIGMALHNAPEGVAVYLSTMRELSFGASLAFAIGCHNLPEGMAVAIPLFFATKNKRFTIQMTLINGMFEPAAVLLCALVFGWDSKTANISESANSSMLAAVAGIMSFISFYELYPSSIEYCGGGRNHDLAKQVAMLFLTLGMFIGFLVMTIIAHV